MEVESILLALDISDLVALEPETDDIVLTLLLPLLLLPLLLLLWYSSLKLESLLLLLSLTSSSNNAEAHMAKLTPCWRSRTELHRRNDMMR